MPKDTAPPLSARRQSSATPSWQNCLDAGMTAREAAEARGYPPNAATAWESRTGKKFRKLTLEERRKAYRQGRRSGLDAKVQRIKEVEPRPPVQRFTPTSEMDRAINAAFATVFGDRWEGPQ